MINNKTDYIFYLEADRIISGRLKKNLSGRLKSFFMPDHIGKFMRLLRKVEYYQNCRKDILGKLNTKYLNHRFRNISLKLGFSIPPNTFGPGLFIPHYGTIVINAKVRIGANCVLHTCVGINTKEQLKIGDNAYVATGVIIAGNIELSDNITISANSFVNKSFDQSNMLIGGSPAKVLKERKAWFFEDGKEFERRVNKINDFKNELYK